MAMSVSVLPHSIFDQKDFVVGSASPPSRQADVTGYRHILIMPSATLRHGRCAFPLRPSLRNRDLMS